MWNAISKNILTTIGGLAVLAGGILEAVGEPTIGKAVAVAGGTLIGLAARDSNVTSEQAGAKPEQPQ